MKCKKKIPKEYIKGGYGANQPRCKYDQRELKMGRKVEMEHTTDPKVSEEIASDHLEEIPDYYTRLDKMEHKYEREQKRGVVYVRSHRRNGRIVQGYYRKK